MDIGPFLLEQAQLSPHVHFLFELATGHVVYVNAAYEQVLGGSVERVNDELPQLLQRVHTEDSSYLTEAWIHWTHGELVEEVEFRLLDADQTEQWLLLTPSYGPRGLAPTWVGGVIRDITAQKHYKANADYFNSRKNGLLEILSVDLADCLSLAERLKNDPDSAVQDYIRQRLETGMQRIASISQNSVQLIRRFVEEEMQTSITVEPNFERVELGEKLQHALSDHLVPSASPIHKLSLHLPPHPVYLLLDVNKFLQVITNLLSNSIKFTPDGGNISLSVGTKGPVVRLAFSDTGIGIPKRWQDFLFERNTPARRPGLRGEPGAGIGLSICKTIVELHKGSIRVASLEGEGTTVIIELPILPEQGPFS
jgi:two-component system sensor histidine kinase VicK